MLARRCDQHRRIPRSRIDDLVRDRAPDGSLARLEDLEHGCPSPVPKAVRASRPGLKCLERQQMGLRQILDVHVIPDAGAVTRRPSSAENAQTVTLSQSGRQHQRDQMTLAASMLAVLTVLVCAAGVEVPQQGKAEAERAGVLRIIHSHANFVVLYGVSGCCGESSVSGISAWKPYVAAVELKTSLSIPCRFMASSTFLVPTTLTRQYLSGSAIDSGTDATAAKCITARTPRESIAESSEPASQMSPTIRRPCGTASRFPSDRSSKANASCPRFSR